MVQEQEMEKFLKKGIISEVRQESEDQVVSNIFLRPKSDGSVRTILNLKKFNELLDKKHFKMESMTSALNLVRKNAFFSKIDLKDAYFSVAVDEDSKSFFRFRYEGEESG